MVSLLHMSRYFAASLSSARFIPDIVCSSSIHLFLGRPLFLLPSPHTSILSFSIPFARIHGQRTSSSVLLPSVSAINLLLPVRSPSELIRLFSSQSKRSSASFSRSTFRRPQFSSPFLLSCNHTVSPERSLHLQFLFCLQTHMSFQDPALPLYPALSSFVSPFCTCPRPVAYLGWWTWSDVHPLPADQ